jgi:hypothetical protein
MVVTDLESEELEKKDPISERIIALKEQIDHQYKENQKIVTGLDQKLLKIEEVQKSQNEQFKSIRQLLYFTMPQTKIRVTNHSEPLVKFVWERLRQENPQMKNGWTCKGKEFKGCLGSKDDGQRDLDELHWHCAECSFDYCDDCYKHYGKSTHPHELKRLTLAEIS